MWHWHGCGITSTISSSNNFSIHLQQWIARKYALNRKDINIEGEAILPYALPCIHVRVCIEGGKIAKNHMIEMEE